MRLFYSVLGVILYPYTTTNTCKVELSYNVLIVQCVRKVTVHLSCGIMIVHARSLCT